MAAAFCVLLAAALADQRERLVHIRAVPVELSEPAPGSQEARVATTATAPAAEQAAEALVVSVELAVLAATTVAAKLRVLAAVAVAACQQREARAQPLSAQLKASAVPVALAAVAQAAMADSPERRAAEV